MNCVGYDKFLFHKPFASLQDSSRLGCCVMSLGKQFKKGCTPSKYQNLFNQ
jgi:hypothetical protein